MFVYSEEAYSPSTNRLAHYDDNYFHSEYMVDFSNYDDLDDIIAIFEDLLSKNLHIIGSRCYVYHSQGVLDTLKGMKQRHEEGLAIMGIITLPRTGGLRSTVMTILS